ncbi:MAG: DUF3048 domain-containing protein [Lachnospiraceae bacterium]
MKRRTLMILAILTMAVALSACGKKEEETIETVVETSEAQEESLEENSEEEAVVEDVLPEGMYFSELTNEPIDESLKNQRPIAAMVDNELTALPHFGMNEADVVYELMNSTKNNRITRFMVLVKDWEKIEQLGSIRSVRPTNILLAAEWNAVVCHDGGPFYIDPYFANDYAAHFSGIFSRVNNGKSREFTEYIMPGDLDKAFNSSNISREYNEYYPGPHYQFAPKADPIDLSENEDAIEAKTVDLPFAHNGSYLEYDEETQMYNYFEYGDPHLDGATNEQLCFKNLLIQYCTFHQYDENGYLIFNCIDRGKAGYYVTNGKAIPVTWAKTSDTDPTRYYDKDGNEISINTGKTYVALVPDDNWQELIIK